jgi:SAM-dependent methyltransferase
VCGIDLCQAVVARLREKLSGEDIEVTIGDFATTRVEGSFALAYLLFNTIGNLTAMDRQVARLWNVAEHLQPGGCFVIEVNVPQLSAPPARRALPPVRRQRDPPGDR